MGHFKTKNLENRLKPKILFLREDFSPLFRLKNRKKSNATVSSF